MNDNNEALIDEPMIERLVRAFYTKVREDELIGPVFAARIRDWEPHLQQMFAFWSSVMLTSGRYRGNPMMKHMPLPIDQQHFGRWLELFEETAYELCPPAAAALFVDRAHRIAESLMMNLERFRALA
jgi:hemoglobin